MSAGLRLGSRGGYVGDDHWRHPVAAAVDYRNVPALPLGVRQTQRGRPDQEEVVISLLFTTSG